MEVKDIQDIVEENRRLAAQVERLTAEKAELENTVSSLKSMMAWFRKKLFGSMSEKNLPLAPSVLEPTLFDISLPEEKQTFVIAPLPEMAIPKGMASESLLADILIDKYVYHLPFYRVMQKYRELGVLLSDSTIGDWFNAVCSRLRPLYDKLRERIMSSDYIQVDESTLPVIDNEKHRAVKGYIWAVRDAVCGDVYFPLRHGLPWRRHRKETYRSISWNRPDRRLRGL